MKDGALAECISVIPSYDCVNGDCIDPGDGSGQYQSLLACNAACINTVESWNCINSDCVDPGDGLGQYDSESWCLSVCSNSSIEEINQIQKSLIKIVNVLGQEVDKTIALTIHLFIFMMMAQ